MVMPPSPSLKVSVTPYTPAAANVEEPVMVPAPILTVARVLELVSNDHCALGLFVSLSATVAEKVNMVFTACTAPDGGPVIVTLGTVFAPELLVTKLREGLQTAEIRCWPTPKEAEGEVGAGVRVAFPFPSRVGVPSTVTVVVLFAGLK